MGRTSRSSSTVKPTSKKPKSDSDVLDSQTKATTSNSIKSKLVSGSDPTDIRKDGQVVMLKDNSAKWKSMQMRAITGFSLMGLFFVLLFLGTWAIVGSIVVVQVITFYELTGIRGISYQLNKENKTGFFKFIPWIFLLSTMYYFNGGALISILSRKTDIINDLAIHLPGASFFWDLVRFHKLITFFLYSACITLFVLSLKKGYYKYQFVRLGFTILGIVFLIIQSHVLIYNVFEGVFWFVFPLSLIVVNDTSAYFWGFFFGKNSLIALSPKKTWEGFIGALFTTIVWAWYIAPLFAPYPYFVCPAQHADDMLGWVHFEHFINHDDSSSCLNSNSDSYSSTSLAMTLWAPTSFETPEFLQLLFGPMINALPIQFHAVIMAIVASTIAPFGGYFASGFKRAFGIKDFSDTLGAHGGFIDRLDCQFVMAIFVYIYLDSVLKKSPDVVSLEQMRLDASALSFDDQISLLHYLEKLTRS